VAPFTATGGAPGLDQSRVQLDNFDRGLLDGTEGEAAKLAMRILLRMADIAGADRFIDISSAHIDSCLYHGRSGLDFAERLAAGGAHVRVPATLNVSSLDLLHPHLYRGDAETAVAARKLMDAYVSMGCTATWTCAPYQLQQRPSFGEHVAWAESNAIVFANSVLGARTDRYGDFIDICAAITGRVPDAGLHRTEQRRGRIVFSLAGLSERLLDSDLLLPLLGHIVGSRTGTLIPVIDGLSPEHCSEDRFKAFGAAAASSGAVAMFHVVGVTPEASTLDAALQGMPPDRTIDVSTAMLREANEALTTATGRLTAVSLGTPHFSVAEFERLMPLVTDVRFADGVDVYVSTGRDVLRQVAQRGWLETMQRAGITIVTDTCTYITPILRQATGTVMTNSAKWANYAPGNLGVEVAFGTLSECIRSARIGRVWRDDSLWAEAN
jgi:predicted aconitase